VSHQCHFCFFVVCHSSSLGRWCKSFSLLKTWFIFLLLTFESLSRKNSMYSGDSVFFRNVIWKYFLQARDLSFHSLDRLPVLVERKV
jgi:hypothetical protein